jgi:four helix bundle protein
MKLLSGLAVNKNLIFESGKLIMRSQFQTYNLAVEFYKSGLNITMPAHLKSQFERASSSIVLNLAEGSGRKTTADRGRFFTIALGSLRESQAILDLIDTKKDIVTLADRLGACLWKLCYGR